ncbi:MAG TPA: ribosome maturation factor RimM [Rugosimonospora sp.]|nr:ribosome maturation factor RimM [Rugosimonospora sp.]
MQLVVGVIARPHGVRGEVVVDITTDEPAARYVVGTALATDPPAAGPLTIEAVRPHQGRLLVAFEGVLDRNAAQVLRGVKLCVDSADVPEPTDPDEFSDFQLIGLAAVGRDGEHLGEVVRVRHGPAADLLVLRLPEGREALVPFVKAIVPEVDLAAGRVVLTPPGGLLDL